MPGRCPSCNQIYTDETLSFCPNDGTPLQREAPPAYDPQGGLNAGYPPQPPQQGYYPGAPQPGAQQPPPGWQQPPPYGQQQQYPPQYGAPGGGGKSKLPIILAALAVLLIGGGVGAYFLLRDNSSSTSNTNRNSNTKIDVNIDPPPNTTTTTLPTPTTSTPTTTTLPTPDTAQTPDMETTPGDYTEDQKHRLFQTVGVTGDDALIVKVAQKIGILDSSGQPNEKFQPFVDEHLKWQKKNLDFARQYLDPAKAKEYVLANM